MPGKHTAAPSFCTLIATLIVWQVAHAEVYKWVDDKGQTHYSERKTDAGGAKAAEVRITPPPEAPTTSTPSTDYLRAQSKFAPRPVTPVAPGYKPPSPSLSGGREDGSDAARCKLARDVLSGAVRHGNGKPTDQYDREVARNDIRAFCR
ncbi:DUF4124 domain-containing protein [Aquabacterium sp.]|uniref:DUF4124 domain-containing protein n=1 Tax=Aquabacterium sp. TaxID=1872578 RepID=UPI0039C8BDF1